MHSNSLRWEWRANRAIVSTISGTLMSVEKESSGWFGIRASPSMADSMPDPVVATITTKPTAESDAKVSTYTLRLPKKELEPLVVGDLLLLEMINPTTCVGVKVDAASK